MEAEHKMASVGVSCSGKGSGDLMLLAAFHGLINVVKFFESNLYPINFQNALGDSCLHMAARGV